MVWKQNDSYSTFVPLHERQEQHGTALLLFQSKRFQFLRATFVSSFNVHYICQWTGVSGLRGVVGDLQQTKPRRLQTP